MPGMSVSTGATNVQSTSYHAGTYERPQRLTELPDFIDGARNAAVLRRRAAVPVGALGSADVVTGRRLVRARDAHDASWWIPASLVWSDADDVERPEHPWFVGLATDLSWSRAVLSGLSHRLAWEARLAHEAGAVLPLATGIPTCGTATVFDARVGHDVPTVHIVSDNVVRGAAGSTIDAAYRRALYGDRASTDVEIDRELADVQLVLADAGLDVAVVDVGTALLRKGGVSRVSVQLLPR
jgi:hypothetical protein